MKVVQNKDGIGNPIHNDDGTFGSKNDIGSSNLSKEELSEILLGKKDINDFYKGGSQEADEIDSLFEDGNNIENNDSTLEEINDDDLDAYFEKISKKEEFEVSNKISKLTYDETRSTLANFYEELDLAKVESLDEDGAKKLLQAMQSVHKKQDELIALNEKYENTKFYNLWIETVSPLNYNEKKDKIINKQKYFELDYKGTDGAEKIEQLLKFKAEGEKYLQEKEQIEEKYKKYQDYISKFENPDFAYSQARKDNAIWIKDMGQMAKIKKSHEIFGNSYLKALKAVGGMDSNEFKTVKYYTSSYSSFNEPLRKMTYTGGNMMEQGFVKQVEAMTNFIDNATIDFDVWVQRGTNNITDTVNNINISWGSSEKALKNLVGKSFVDNGFVSCGAAKSTGFTGKNIIMNVYCPKGTKMLYVDDFSNYSGENEVILQRGYTYKITKTEKVNEQIYLDVEVVKDSDKNKYNTEQLEQIEKEYVKGYY